MAYEFADDDPIQAVPTTPDYWHVTPERILQVVPFVPLFIGHYSVIEDPQTQQLGIDSNDRLPDSTELKFHEGRDPIGLLRVESLQAAESGYVIDLRYAAGLVSRSLDFDDGYRDEEDDYKTVPVLAAIFHDPEIEALRLRACYRDARLEGFAVRLMEFVDYEREKRGASVWATRQTKQPKAKSEKTRTNVEFSALGKEHEAEAD